jgi:sugar lactone lactonase YvrE
MKHRSYYLLSNLIFLNLLLMACGNPAATETILPIGTEAPAVIPLPNGFQPEGIASGNGTTFYVGSIPSGAIFRGDVQTGEGEILVEKQRGRMAIGLKYDPRSGLLFVAGGAMHSAYVYDGETGENVAEIELTTSTPSFINDVVITRDAAYFTDSQQPVLYKVLLENNGELPDVPVVEEITLGGDYDFADGEFNANGIDAIPDGTALLLVNTVDGILYAIHPTTGIAKKIDLGASTLEHGDGLLLKEKILYVVQNTLNQIAVIELNSDFSSGTIIDTITSPSFRVPTTIAGIGNAVYAVNARFGIDPTPDTEYEVVRVPEE